MWWLNWILFPPLVNGFAVHPRQFTPHRLLATHAFTAHKRVADTRRIARVPTATLPVPPWSLAIPATVASMGGVLSWKKLQSLKVHRKTFLQGKVVWVTGASSGIGKAVALAFARKGAKLVLSARREAQLEEVAAECALIATGSDQPIAARILPFDLSGPMAELPPQAHRAAELWGGDSVDVVVHCGGVSSRSAAVETDLEVDARVMNINYFAPVALSKALLPRMLERQQGHIVVVSSVQGRLALPYRTSYSASKHALHGFFEALRAEIADRGVKVTLVCPGYVRTNLSLNAVTGKGVPYAKLDASTAKGMEPDDLAARIVDAVVTGRDEVTAADLTARIAIVSRALIPRVLTMYMAQRARKQYRSEEAALEAEETASS